MMANFPDEEHIVRILRIEAVTHNVRRFTLTKPVGYVFKPGQATDVCINKLGWQDQRRPFTFTALNDWDHLEFTIKIYNDHQGVTNQLGQIQEGDELIIHDVFGTINYHGEGVFIAGGAGVTPFIAIIRQLYNDNQLGNNTLIFSNKTEKDIILAGEFKRMLGDRFINTLTHDLAAGYDHRKIDTKYLQEKLTDFSVYFYLCGPDPMVADVKEALLQAGAKEERIITEQF